MLFIPLTVLMLCCSGVTLTLTPDLDPGPPVSPCLVDDVLSALRDAVGDDGRLNNQTMTQFGLCLTSDTSVLSEVTQGVNRKWTNGPDFLLPTSVLLTEEEERQTLTFDLPPSPLLKLNPVLLVLVLENARQDLDLVFTSRSLQPNTQTVCLSGQTQYVLLKGKTPSHQKWRISVESSNPELNQSLRDFLIGGKPGSNISVIPLLLFPAERGTDSSHGQTHFLCELKRFLSDVLPEDGSDSAPLHLNSLQSLPPLSLDLSSSDSLLSGLINASSSVTVFSFSGLGPALRELALPQGLLGDLERRLEQTLVQTMEELLREEVDQRAAQRLRRLKHLTEFPKNQPVTGELQFRSFLLLKALQTVALTYEHQRGLRATRSGQTAPPGPRGNICGLRSLSVSLDRRLGLPNTVQINNCQGLCSFPLVNTNNHAVLLHFHLEGAPGDQRGPCCVPTAYTALEVVDLNEQGTYLAIKPDVVATECGCR